MLRPLGVVLALLLVGAAPSVYFSPKGGCTAALIEKIDGAKKQIRVQAYSFTSPPIAEALARAKKRGVDVVVILDKTQPQAAASQWPVLLRAKVPVYIDAKHAIAHNKLTMIDGLTVATGSFNYTNNAENNNAENLLIFDDQELAELYLKNWQVHRDHAVRLSFALTN